MNKYQRFGKLTGILLIFVILLISAKAYQITYFINDYSGLLSEAEIAEIEPILKEIYDSGTAEYAIVIIDSLEGQDIEGYAYKLAEGNLGDTEKNNGLLLLIALNDRKYRFEVGRGLEPVLPDIIMGRLGRKYIGPNFKIGEYGKGILEASIAIKEILNNNTDSPYYEDKKPDSLSTGMIIFLILFFVFFFLIIFISSSTKKSKKGIEHRKDKDFFLAALLLSQMLKGGRGGSGSGRFGGFGGGSFGGGGASGGW